MCIPSNSYVCLAINPKQHCQTSTTEIVKINTKGLGREILRSPREGNFKGVSWKLGVINHHGLKEKFRNCIMPFAWLKIMESWWKRQEKKINGKIHKHLCSKKKLQASNLLDESRSAEWLCLLDLCLEYHLLGMGLSYLKR